MLNWFEIGLVSSHMPLIVVHWYVLLSKLSQHLMHVQVWCCLFDSWRIVLARLTECYHFEETFLYSLLPCMLY